MRKSNIWEVFARCIFCLIAVCMVGCGNGNFPVRPVTGTVVCDGQPVSKGSVSFTPLGDGKSSETGKPASAALASDGSFKLSTFDRFDGAIVGKHRVEYTGSEGEDEEDAESDDDESKRSKPAAAESTQRCTLKGELVVEVKSSGENVFKIELTKSK